MSIMWVLTAISITGVILNIQKNRWCFILWSVTNTSWMVIDWYHGLYAQAALFAFNLATCLWGLWHWRDRGVGNDEMIWRFRERLRRGE